MDWAAVGENEEGDGDGENAVISDDGENRGVSEADRLELVDANRFGLVAAAAVIVSANAAECTSGVANELVVGGIDDEVGMTVSRPVDDDDLSKTCA